MNNKDNTARLVISIVTLLIALFLIGISVWALTLPFYGLFIIGLMLAGGFGRFCYNDYKYFFGKQ